ncbi:hypothetical protein Q7P35_003214 [Cladosporium inversicolor]
MADIEYGSLSGVLQNLAEPESNPNATNIARRSISIFSRRGADATEPKQASLSQAAMSTCPTKKMSERQHTWLRRKSMDVRKTHEKGTILNAVPPAERIQMSRLEREMATSPNEEIMSAISAQLPIQNTLDMTTDHVTEPHQLSPYGQSHSGSIWESEEVHRTDSVKRRETNTRIGVWVDGVAHWDEPIEQLQSRHNDEAGHTPDLPQNLVPASNANTRPNLTVTIPGNERSIPRILLPACYQGAGLIAPANRVSKFEHPPPRITVDDTIAVTQAPVVTEHKSTAHHETAQELQPNSRRVSSSTTSSTLDQSDASVYSKRSSTTSIDPAPATACLPDHALDIHKPLPRVPLPHNMRAAPAPPSSPTADMRPRSEHVTRSAPGTTKRDRYSLDNIRTTKKPAVRGLLDLDVIDAEFIRASPYAPSLSDTVSEADSPTLSQAEYDLQAQLGTIDEVLGHEETADMSAVTTSYRHGITKDEDIDVTPVGVTSTCEIQRSDSVHSVMQPPARAPTLPKRSRKRDWRNSTYVDTSTPQVIQPPPKAPGRRKSESTLPHALATQHADQDTNTHVHRSESEKVVTGVNRRYGRGLVYKRSPGSAEPTEILPEITVDPYQDAHDAVIAHVVPAEQVLLHILSSLTSLRDLFNLATINKGMYRVFKENELHLIKTVTRNGSAAALELREWRAQVDDENDNEKSTVNDDLPASNHAPLSFCRSQRCDEDTVKQLKQLILGNCQTFMRRETALSFAHPNHPGSQRFTDAFWRAWTFCTIFGSRKGREEDVTGQLDWLKGGTEANNQSFSATVNTNLDFDMGSILLNAPDHFAQGNKGGLSATQLYDMTELWNCLSALLTGYQGEIYEARHSGVFANCGIKEGDIELEEHMLEEWIAFVMTLGLDVVLELAKHAVLNPSAGFELAKSNGWTEWSPSVTGSRATFLREPAARLYEERISVAAMQMQSPDDMEKKETARKRVAALAAEIRLRRQTSGYKRLPLIDMHSERAMSMISRRSSAVPKRSAQMVQTSNLPPATRYHAYSAQSARPRPQPSHDSLVSPLSHMPSTASARPSSPSSLWSSRHISPIIEGRVEAFNRLSLANLDGIAESTVEVAVQKITEMGFTKAQATHALRMTDMGDGLRIDRAVDMLLRN